MQCLWWEEMIIKVIPVCVLRMEAPPTITWSLSLHVPDGCCSTAYLCSALLWYSASILHLHDHLWNVNGLIDLCASMITGSDLCRECSQFAWPVARTRRKLFSSAMPIFPSVAGCYHFASITVLAIVHLTRRMQSVPFVHLPLSEML